MGYASALIDWFLKSVPNFHGFTPISLDLLRDSFFSPRSCRILITVAFYRGDGDVSAQDAFSALPFRHNISYPVKAEKSRINQYYYGNSGILNESPGGQAKS